MVQMCIAGNYNLITHKIQLIMVRTAHQCRPYTEHYR